MVALSQNINTDKTLDFVLVSAGQTNLSGHVYDPLGNGVANQKVSLWSPQGLKVVEATTDTSGTYTLPPVSPATDYKLQVEKEGNPSSINLPTDYLLVSFNDFSLTQSKVVDITIPVHTINFHVQDNSGTPIENATVKVIPYTFFSNTDLSMGGVQARGQASSVKTTNAEGDSSHWLYFNNASNSYTIIVTPPSGSGLQPKTLSNISITSNTTQTVTLEQPVTLSGHVYDPLGNGVANQKVSLWSSQGLKVVEVTTDATGSYTLPSVSPATDYRLQVEKEGNLLSINLPESYYLASANEFTLTQNKVVDITIPVHKINFHIQDSLGMPIENATVRVIPYTAFSNTALSVDGILARGNASGTKLTNESGDAFHWLYLNNADNSYTIIVTPPSGSSFEQFTLTNTSITSEQTKILSLQYNHATPLTTAALETEQADGTYSNPTTVTLSATAASGYTVSNTYYKVDGGTQQAYVTPFTVLGEGEHTIEYWSVDNSGVEEIHQTESFTIHQNQAPVVDPFAGGTIDRGQTFTASSSFTDADSTSWTATVDYGDIGGGEEPLTLNPDKTFSLSHQYNTAGEYEITVVIRDEQQSTGSTQATVTVVIPDPVTTTFTSSADSYVRSGGPNRNLGAGVFMRLQSSGDNRSLVRFDQSAMQSEIGTKEVLSAKLRVTITDGGTGWGSTGRTIDAHRLLANWTEGNGTENNQGTGSGLTWNCATDSNIDNSTKNCSGTTEWEMGQPNNPSVHPWAQTASATQTITNNQSGVIEFDVTADVANFLNGTNQNYGWLIKKTDEGQSGNVSFGTKESSTVPQLVVTYQP